ncbi:MAG: formate--tetrahydrofolate ligase [Planctomycetota bacterium]
MHMIELERIAAAAGIAAEHLVPHGRGQAKVMLDALADRRPRAKLCLISAITPTDFGEGKTTLAIGLAQALERLGHRSALALRQPSMGPVFGRKGGGTGGGRSTLVPADSINLHFTGDFHAITTAHNLLAAAIDNRLYHRHTRLDAEQVRWPRVLDIDDRALRSVRIGQDQQGVPRASRFDITPASEIMAAFCLAESLADLRARLDRMVVGFAADGEPVLAAELKVTGAMLAVLRDALAPNLVRSGEGVAAFVHGGPFGNIAHGCNSILATRMAMTAADYAITEAGFGFDLGGEKFFDIKCRAAGLAPDVVVIVATLRALKAHGGKAVTELATPDPDAVLRGVDNLGAHIDAAAQFGRPVVVALNQFPADTTAEEQLVLEFCRARGVPCATADVYARGGAGGEQLAALVVAAGAGPPPTLLPLYRVEAAIAAKIDTIATRIYGADGADFTELARRKIERFTRAGFGALPICMAKTQSSLADTPKRVGRPRGFRITVRDLDVASGAGFLVALTGEIVRMPALPRSPAAERIDVDERGRITGLAAEA